MKNMKRIISFFIAVIMVVSMLPAVSFAAVNEMDLSVSAVSGCPGETVNVEIDLANNPGISSLKFDVSYDETYLTLTSVSFSEDFGAYVTAPEPYGSPQTISLISPLTDISADGLFATLSFSIAEDAPDGATSAITAAYDEDDIFDSSYNNIAVHVTNGAVSVYTGIPGDVTGDRRIDNRDAIMLFRYVAGWSVEVNYGALDVTGDERIDNRDAIMLFRYVAGWPNITLSRGTGCTHVLDATEAVAPSCNTNGSIAYWRCTLCGKYFSDANATKEIRIEDTALAPLGHTPAVDPAVPPTTVSDGLTEGSHCAVCGVVLVSQQVIPRLETRDHTITYDVSNGDPYLEGLQASGNIENSNPSVFSEDSGLTLRNLSVRGYRFLGWYDGAGANAVQIKKIDAGTAENIELYAHWEKIPYVVQFKSSLYLEEREITYTVDTGVVLPTPKLSNYVFTGWANEQGKLYNNKKIPAGTTGNITLTANWTSERNKTWTKTDLDDPIIEVDEDNNTLLFVYEIGSVENVPLYTIKDFGYISGDGITKTETATYSVTITDAAMEAYTKAVSSATTQSSDWTLSEEWNETCHIEDQWLTEHNKTEEQARSYAMSNSNTWNVSSGNSGSTDKTHLETNQDGWQREAKVTSGNSSSNTLSGSATLNTEATAKCPVAEMSIGAELSAGVSATDTSSSGLEMGGANTGGSLKTDSTVTNSAWNNSSSYGGSSSNSSSTTTSTAISEKICESHGYGKSYLSGGSSSNTRALSTTQASSDEYASSVTYSTASAETTTSTWTTQSTKPGYHRWVVAGTAHVFAVVGYDMKERSYFAYTYSVMDDETHEFEDYSYTTANYNDEQNGVISFEVPYEVSEYVADLTCYSEGLKVNQDSGVITGYNGTDNCVVIPEYMNVGGGKVVKITGISSSAFRGNTAIEAVVLSDYIEEIPDNAFAGCTSLVGLSGGAITSIGENAFAGCKSVGTGVVSSRVSSLGANAFRGAQRLLVNAVNADVLEAAVQSGARDIELFVTNMNEPAAELSGREIIVPESVEYFEFNGGRRTYSDLKIRSDAGKTVINDATFTGDSGIPIQISSLEAAFDGVTILATGIAMVLSAEDANVGLQGAVSVQSENVNALLCKNVTLYETNPQVDGRLVVCDKALACGDIVNRDLLVCNAVETIDEETFYHLLRSFKLSFDPAGGTCEETSREVPNSTPIGDLPVPKMPHFTFVGWFLPGSDTAVTKDTVFSAGLDQTLVAHWIENPLSGWVKASEVPAGAEIVNRKWTYTLTSYTTSSSPSLAGWSKYGDTKSEWGPWGSWSGWSTNAVSGSDSRQVETETRHTGYDMVCYNTMSTGGSRQFRSYSIAGSYSAYGCSSAYGQYTYTRGASVSEVNSAATVAEGSYTSSCSYPGYNKGSGTGYILPYGDASYVFFINNYTYCTYYRYRDRSLLSTYYYTKSENKEASTMPSGSNISNVQEWVQYRAE